MPKELTDNLKNQLKIVASKMAHNHRLSPEEERELLGHLEDKTIDYLSGEEKMSEEDILLLVREHFGNPETLHALRSKENTPRPASLMDDLLNSGWGNPTADNLFGVFLLPWKQTNRIRFTVWVFFLVDLLTNFGSIVLYLFAYHHVWIIIVSQFIPILVAALNYYLYAVIGRKMDTIRQELRHSADIQADCILVNSLIQSPCIIQYINDKLLFTPLVGNTVQCLLSDVKKVRESRNCNGKLLLGNNRFFQLNIFGLNERFGFAVANAQIWRTLFQEAAPSNNGLTTTSTTR